MRLVPQNRQLIELLARASHNLVEISDLLVELFEGFPASLPIAEQIREREAVGDELTHQLVRLLDSSFVVPYDREDLHALSGRLDDVCDHIDEAASQMVVYGVRHVPETAVDAVDDRARRMPRARRGRRAHGRPDRGERAAGRGAHARERRRHGAARGDRRAVRRQHRCARGDPLEGHPRAARERDRRAASRPPTCSRARSSRAGDVSVLLVLVVATALVFDFTNGFHDTANAVATSVSTRALSPRTAVALAAVMNFVGALVTTSVARTIGEDLVARRRGDQPAPARRAGRRDRVEPHHLVGRPARRPPRTR